MYGFSRLNARRLAAWNKEGTGMDQLHLLWEYQKADMAADKMEMSIKRSPTRQKLTKYRDYVM